MAEVAELADGIDDLTTLFDNAVDCFDYIQLGRSFERDFQTSLLKLDNTRRRLSRWGRSVGIGRDRGEISKSTEHKQKVEQELSHLLELFKTAESISTKFKQDAAPNDPSLRCNSETSLDATMAYLHDTMRGLSIEPRSHGRAGLWKKLEWAIYEEKHFNQLIKNIIDVVDGLVELFPAAQQEQRRLCKIELELYRKEGDESLLRLKSIVAGQDPYMEAAIVEAMRTRHGHSYDNVRGSDQAILRIGDEVSNGAQVTGRPHTYTNIFGSGNAIVHAGNSYRATSIFDFKK